MHGIAWKVDKTATVCSEYVRIQMASTIVPTMLVHFSILHSSSFVGLMEILHNVKYVEI